MDDQSNRSGVGTIRIWRFKTENSTFPSHILESFTEVVVFEQSSVFCAHDAWST